jgi:hypothetical protein
VRPFYVQDARLSALVIYSRAIVISSVIAAVELSLTMRSKAAAGLNEVPHHANVQGSGALILHS